MPRTVTSIIERICAKSRREDRGYSTPCRVSTGAKRADGYARVSTTFNGPQPYVHDVVYEHVYGPIVHELHHLCRQRDCHEPLHLVDLTRAEHMQEHRVTHCRRAGHEYTSENTYVRTDGERECRACRAERRKGG